MTTTCEDCELTFANVIPGRRPGDFPDGVPVNYCPRCGTRIADELHGVDPAVPHDESIEGFASDEAAEEDDS